MTLDPKTILVKNVSQTTKEQAKQYVRTIEPSSPTSLSDPYIEEVYRLYPLAGYSPEVVIGQWAVETGAGTSNLWKIRHNPAGIGVTDGGDTGYSWVDGPSAAQGQVVHLSGYVDGYNRGLRKYLGQDPRYLTLLGTDYAESVQVVSDLTGKWATDPQYGEKIAWRIEGLRKTKPDGPVPPNPPTSPPPLVWVGTNNYGIRAKGQVPLFLVHHITDDLVYSNVSSWFRNPSSQASANFVIDRDGSIYQFVSTLNYPWTNGDVNKPRADIPAMQSAMKKDAANGWNFNGWCITIEYVGTPEIPPTNKQYDAGISIARYCLATYPTMSPHRYGQLRHSDINSVARSYCPGPKFDLSRIITAIGGDPQRLS